MDILKFQPPSHIEYIFKKYLETRSILKTLEFTEINHIHTKQWRTQAGVICGGGKISKSTLNSILKNITYTGRVNYKGFIAEAEFEAIIDRETFDEAQKILSENSVERGPKVRNKHEGLLAGKVFCSVCNSPMRDSYTKKSDNKIYRYYICSNALKRGWSKCPKPSLPALAIEDYVLEEISEISKDKDLCADIVISFNQKNQEELAQLLHDEKVMVKFLKEVRERIKTCENFDILKDLKKQEADLGASLKDMEISKDEVRFRIDYGSDRLKKLLTDFHGIWQSLTFNEKFAIIDLLIDRVNFNGISGEISITYTDCGIKKLEGK